MNAFWNTMAVATGAGLMTALVGVGVLVAWMGLGRWGRRGLLGVALVTMAMPPFLVANCWLEWSAGWRLKWGAEHSATAMLPWTAFVLASLTWPIPALLAMGESGRLGRAVFDAVPGLRGADAFRYLLWPMVRGPIALGASIAAVLSAANFSIPTLFQVRVLPESMWVRFNTELDVLAAWVAGMPLVLAGVGIVWAGRRHRMRWPATTGEVTPGAWRGRLGWVWLVGMVWAVAWVGVGCVLPLLDLVVAPRTWRELGSAFSAAHGALGGSLGLTAAAALVMGWATIGLSVWGRMAWVRWGAWLLFLMPGLLLSTPWVPVLSRPEWRGVSDAAVIPVLLMALRYLAIPWTVAVLAWEAADRASWEALRGAGASRWQAWRWAVWPQSRLAIGMAMYAAWLLMLWEVESVILILPPGVETLPVRIFNLLHYGHSGQVNALCVVLLGVALLPLVLGGMWAGRFRFGKGRNPGAGGMSLVCVLGLFSAGCSDAGKGGAVRVPIESVGFSHVEVIGSRGVAPGQFNKPRSLVCDRDDHLYVADVTGRIQKFGPDGRFERQWQMEQTDLGKPKGMGLDPEGRVIVVEPHYMRVNHFDGEGVLKLRWGVKGTRPGAFILPRSVAVNSRGEYFLSEYTVVDRVQRFDPAAAAGGAPVWGTAWGEPGEAPGQFNRAEGLAIGPSDEVYVADSCNHRIQVFDRTGKYLRAHGRAGSNPGDFSYPYDIRVDQDGNQFVCEFGNSRITVLDARDRVVEVLGSPGSAPGHFANPWAVALDSRGNLYVADSQNHRVQKFIRRTPRSNARAGGRS